MEFKKVIFILGIAICLAIGMIFGASYAWYAYSNAETAIGGSTIDETPTVIFSQTEYIASSTSVPIQDEDSYNYANKNSFTVTLNENLQKYHTAIKVVLKDIVMSDELKIATYKFALMENGYVVSSGNFSNLGNNKELEIMPMKVLQPTTFPQTYSYELLIWLSDDGTVQNNLMNKGFRAKISVVSAIKR